MKKFISYILFLTLAAAIITPTGVLAATKKPVYKTYAAKQLSGKLVLQAEQGNRLWYIDPSGKTRYIIVNDLVLYQVMEKTAQSLTAAEAKKIYLNGWKNSAANIKKYGGKFLLVGASSTPYYFNSANGAVYRVTTYDKFLSRAKIIGLKVSDANLRKLAMNDWQVAADSAFNDNAYVQYDGQKFTNTKNSKLVLPLASLTKVMTALVFLDTKPDWDKLITITPEEIHYPCTLQTCGSTSEVNLKTGDTVKIYNLWVAMLTASSNQSAVILADSTGLSREEFVEKMNAKAAALGLKRTHFEEMSGLSEQNVSTAEEFAVIAKTAFDNETIAAATRYTDFVFPAFTADGNSRRVEVANRNYSLLAFGVQASKSGYLVEAQRNAAVLKDGKIIVTLHNYSLTQRNNSIAKIIGANQIAAVSDSE